MSEASHYRRMGQEVLANKKEEQRGTPESYREMGRRALSDAEKKNKEREKQTGKGMWGASGAALGLVAVGIPLAAGQILKYSLLGWKIGPNGMPQIDKESLADFNKAYQWASGTKNS